MTNLILQILHCKDILVRVLAENKEEWFGMMYLLGAIRRL